MRTAVKHAGAKRALLILSRDAELRIAAEATTSNDTVTVHLCDEPVTASLLPEAVLHDVLHTRESVILDDAAIPNPFSTDPYVAQRHVRSMFCLPLMNQAKLIGALYLENDLAPRVFAPARTAVLKLLASQAAISFENARLYTELLRSEQSLRASRERYAITLSSLADGVIAVDGRGEVTFMNSMAETMTGYALPEGQGCPLDQIFHVTTEQGVAQLASRDGRRVPIDERRAPLIDEAGRADGVVLVFRDLTERQRAAAAEELRKAKERAEAANRAKDEFLANVSHEIRTPMNAILGMTELLLENATTHEHIQSLTTVKSAADALLAIIDDLLDFSKAAAGKVTLEASEWSVRSTLMEMLRSLALRAHRKRLEVISNVEPDVPDTLIGDPLRVRQVLMNLVGNAIKFTAAGEVEVNVTVRAELDGAVELAFAVSDTGIGIPPEKHAVIFEAFQQEDTSTTRQFGGTGLGLTIASALAALMNGRIELASEPGRGSTFTFIAKFARVSSSARPAQRLETVNILVLDDNARVRGALSRWLRNWGASPTLAADLGEARQLLDEALREQRPYQLALIDHGLLEREALDASGEAPPLGELANLQTILMTSGDRPLRPEWADALGVCATLHKPIDQDTLFETIAQALHRKPSVVGRRQLRAPRAGSLTVLVAEDHEFNSQLLELLLAKRGHQMLLATNGHEALAAAEAGGIDVILLDLHMPGLDGFKVIETIRERERTTGGHVPTIALTGRVGTKDRERCLTAGMDDFLAKPIRSDDLWAALERVSRRRDEKRGLGLAAGEGELDVRRSRVSDPMKVTRI
jgi:signal transduction histidine kinase/DNA-binding response OmpR family regulator